MNLYEYALGGARTRETDLYQARGLPDTPPGRPLTGLGHYSGCIIFDFTLNHSFGWRS